MEHSLSRTHVGPDLPAHGLGCVPPFPQAGKRLFLTCSQTGKHKKNNRLQNGTVVGMGCERVCDIVFVFLEDAFQHGRLRYIPLEEFYRKLCPDGDNTCKAVVRITLRRMREQGLVQSHTRARNKREYRPAGPLKQKIIDMYTRLRF